LYDLIDSACEGDIAPAQAQRLQELIAADPEAQRIYVRCVCSQVILERSHSLDLAAGSDLASGDQVGEASLPSNLQNIPIVSPPAPPPASNPAPPLLGFLGNIAQWGQELPGMGTFLWALAGFVGMVVGLPTVLAILAMCGVFRGPTAQLVAASDCQWSAAGAAVPCGSQLSPGRVLDLSAGEVRIAFHRGALVTLQGPCVLEIQSDHSASLRVGSMTAKAESKQSHGFTVQTPTMKLVDLGTEFGVRVGRDGVQEVHVFQGKVQAEPGPGGWFAAAGTAEKAATSTSKSPAPDLAPLVLSASQAIRVDSARQTLTRQAVSWDRFGLVAPPLEPFPIFGTGVGLDEGQADPHWWITEVKNRAGIQPRHAVVTAGGPSSNGHYLGGCMSNMKVYSREDGQWISLFANGPLAPVNDRTTFRTEFDLTGFDPATAKIEGQFVGNDYVTQMRLNGKSILERPQGMQAPYFMRPICIEHGFVAGKNTIEMVVETTFPHASHITHNVMALCVQWKGVARRIEAAETEK
jgi:hypothetical protein